MKKEVIFISLGSKYKYKGLIRGGSIKIQYKNKVNKKY